MPDRVVRVGILTSDRVNTLSWGAEVFYRRLMSVVDDYGRYDGRANVLRAVLYPLKVDRVSEPDVAKWILETEEAGLVRMYTVDKKRFVELLKFGQRLRAKQSKWPNPPALADICQQVPSNDGHVLSDSAGDGDGDVLPTPNGVGALGGASSSASPESIHVRHDVVPPCPHDRIIELYHEVLPMCPRVREWTPARQGHLRARWRDKALANGKEAAYATTAAGIDWWRLFFQHVASSDFLTGRCPGRDGRPPFHADLGWLVKPENFAKVIEGKYANG